MFSGGEVGKIIFEPNDIFKESFESGQKILSIIPAMPQKTDMMLRTLLKIGLETFEADLTTKDEIFDSKFDAARKFALTGVKNQKWFYIVNEDNSKLNKWLKGVSQKDWSENFYADVHKEVRQL